MVGYIYFVACCLASLSVGVWGSDVRELADVRQLVEAHGFQVEELEVTTDDGYILGLQRVINPLVRLEPSQMKTVLLLHGLMSSSADWVMNAEPGLGPELWAGAHEDEHDKSSNSLAFHLANRGYNVLLANVRGNSYGLRHQWMTQEESRFWSFSLDEQIAKDLPAIIGFAQQHYAPLGSGKKLAFVGHSLGAKLMLGLLSERPEFGDQLEPVVLLSPSAGLDRVRTPARTFTQYTFLFDAIDAKFPGSAFARNYLADIECPGRARAGVCRNLLFLVAGFEERNLDGELLDTYLAHVPQPTSVKSLGHLGQEVQRGTFAHFSYGLLGNLGRYHSLSAPAYDLGRVRAPSLALFHANQDWISTPRGVEQLVGALGAAPLAVFNMSSVEASWSHLDFVYGKRAGELLNWRVERLIARRQR